MHSRCHLGKVIKYDTVSKRNWSVAIRSHGIKFIIEELLNDDWEDVENGGRSVPVGEEEVDCVDCYDWEYGDFKGV